MASSLFAFPFNSNLSEQELDSALNGEILIRNISSYKNICLDVENSKINSCLDELKALNPRYFVEVLQIRKAAAGDGVPEKLYELLSNVEAYTEIPYYSERHKTTTPLYSYCKILSESQADGIHRMSVDMTMPPFGVYTAGLSIETDYENFLLYKSKNLTDMTCVSFVRVKENNLRSVISAFKYDGYWIIYGIGAAKAPKISFLTHRIEVAFISRVKAFCSFATSFLD